MLARSENLSRKIMHRTGALVILFAAFTSLAYSVVAGELSFLAMYIVCLIIGGTLASLTAGRDQDRLNAIFTYLVIYSVNVFMILAFAHVLTQMTGAPFLEAPEGVIPDDERFYGYGASIAQAWLRGERPEFPLGVKFYGYPYILAVSNYFSSIFGDISSVSPRLLNAMAGALLPVTVYRVADEIYSDRKISRMAAMLTALFPLFTYYSALLLRDILIAYLIALALLLFLGSTSKPENRSRLLNIGLLCLIMTAIFFIRDLSAAVLLTAIAFYFFIRLPGWAKFVSIILSVVLVAQIVTAIDLDAPKIQMYLTYTERAMEVFTRIESQESLGMKYIIGAPFPLNIFLRIPYTALMPVPPIVDIDLLSLVRGSGAFIWYFFFPLWVYGMWASRKNHDANLITIVSLLFLIGIAMVSIDVRHKTQYLALAMIHVSFAVHSLKFRTPQLVFVTTLVLGVLGVAYFFLRFSG
jgi:hypothetical protein